MSSNTTLIRPIVNRTLASNCVAVYNQSLAQPQDQPMNQEFSFNLVSLRISGKELVTLLSWSITKRKEILSLFLMGQARKIDLPRLSKNATSSLIMKDNQSEHTIVKSAFIGQRWIRRTDLFVSNLLLLFQIRFKFS